MGPRLILVHACAPSDERWRKPIAVGENDRALAAAVCEGWHRLLLARTLEVAGSVDADVRVVSTGRLVALRALAAGRVHASRLELRVDQRRGTRLERLEAAISGGFDDGYAQVVAIAADVPELERAHLEAAFEALDGAGAVIGPALDGGTWLVGANRRIALPTARAVALRVELDAVVLPALADVDHAVAALDLVGRLPPPRLASARDRLLHAALGDLLGAGEPLELYDAFVACSELDALRAAPTIH